VRFSAATYHTAFRSLALKFGYPAYPVDLTINYSATELLVEKRKRIARISSESSFGLVPLARTQSAADARRGEKALTHDTHNDPKRGIFDVLGVRPLT
jgi:hypothetical protein